jgi:acetyl-CoA carboxylase carboxyltransferase component
MAMAGGSFHVSNFIVSWPTGEFGGMGLEGAVRLGFKKELEAIKDPTEREEKFEQLVALHYEHGKAINMASVHEIDDVIDPSETRHWIMCGLRSQPEPEKRKGKKRPNIDCW